ncbi:MAG TPA: glucokinase [Pseudomonadales bacterium]|nr:glucokinase [Pseudomonadales bacterium]
MILAADIGGTSTRLLLCAREGQRLVPQRQAVLASGDYPTVRAALAQFLLPGDNIETACLAVAGPVLHQHCAVTHLPWVLDAAELQAHYGFPVVLINDFVAMAYGLSVLSSQDLLTLQAGEPQPGGTQLLVGAGTGLGIATRINGKGRVYVVESEGGHADFAPHGPQQQALHADLQARLGAVFLETVVSGQGLQNIYRHINGFSADALSVSAADISLAAQRGDADALAAMQLFMACYGSTAGNLALVNVPMGGVYITGGVAAKNAAFLRDGCFIAAFRDKPNMRALLENVPVHVVLNEKLGLLGAAEYAAASGS